MNNTEQKKDVMNHFCFAILQLNYAAGWYEADYTSRIAYARISNRDSV
jgi:hypothetical protein